jgi:excinuclease ABC subunit B
MRVVKISNSMYRSRKEFILSPNLFPPSGDQPSAIESLVSGLHDGNRLQTLLGVTGSGKTYTIANMIANTGKNALIISHNKTLAAQLYSEFKQFFPNNNVGYFISFYDYYQPESYIPQTDTYIEKDTEVNEKIEKMRLEATAMLMSGEPTIIISTVSCIYSLGSPDEWKQNAIIVVNGMQVKRSQLIRQLIDARYERTNMILSLGTFRVNGDIIDIVPGYSGEVIRVSLFGDQVEEISIHEPISMNVLRLANKVSIFPAKHYVIDNHARLSAIESIKKELVDWLPKLPGELERQRLSSRTRYDLEMITEVGYCSGIENYSRHFDGRLAGQPPFCLLDFFNDDFLLIIDESHVTIPQLKGMYSGDYTRKKNLVEYGFRLPSAFDNRPLKFSEFEKYLRLVVFVSATPSDYELRASSRVIEQLVRPTGLVDPLVQVKPTERQIDDLIGEIAKRSEKGERTLVTTLTKRMAEDLAEYMAKNGVKVRYMHSEINGLERTELIRQLRIGEFDVLIGINLLREGLDIPEVSLVAILDADKEGFLRNDTSLIQTFGRAARNVNGKVILYADQMTKSMDDAIMETKRRRSKQIQFNKMNRVVPKTVVKPIAKRDDYLGIDVEIKSMPLKELTSLEIKIEANMRKYAEDLNFEKAINLRNQLAKIRKIMDK